MKNTLIQIRCENNEGEWGGYANYEFALASKRDGVWSVGFGPVNTIDLEVKRSDYGVPEHEIKVLVKEVK